MTDFLRIYEAAQKFRSQTLFTSLCVIMGDKFQPFSTAAVGDIFDDIRWIYDTTIMHVKFTHDIVLGRNLKILLLLKTRKRSLSHSRKSQQY